MVNMRWLVLNFVFVVGAFAPTNGYVASPLARLGAGRDRWRA